MESQADCSADAPLIGMNTKEEALPYPTQSTLQRMGCWDSMASHQLSQALLHWLISPSFYIPGDLTQKSSLHNIFLKELGNTDCPDRLAPYSVILGVQVRCVYTLHAQMLFFFLEHKKYCAFYHKNNFTKDFYLVCIHGSQNVVNNVPKQSREECFHSSFSPLQTYRTLDCS